MDLDALLAGAGGAMQGGLDMYSWQKARQLDEQKLKQQEELASARLRVQELIAYINAGSRENVAGINSGSRERIASNNVFGQNQRWSQPSGNVLAQIGQRVAEETGRNERYDRPSGNATLGAETSRRGQDLTSTTTRRGQDLTAGTARRGQDLNFTLGTDRNTLTGRGQDQNYELDTAAELGRSTRARGMYDNIFGPGAAEPSAPTTTPPVVTPPPTAPAPRPPRKAFVPTPAPGGPTSRGTQPPPKGGAVRSVTMAQIQAIAKRRNTMIEDEIRRAEAEGFTVVR
jgi:hypothetical protein